MREARRFWSTIWERRNHNENAEWINNMETELQRLEEGSQVNIHPDGLKATLKKSILENPWTRWNTRIWAKICSSINDRLATEMTKCIQTTELPE